MDTNKPYALITGANGGIGRALVQAFHASGYEIIATDRVRPPEDLPYAQYFVADLQRTVEDAAYANDIFATVRTMLNGSGLKALINNAAEQILGGVENLSREDWIKTLHVNLLAPFFWTQAFLTELEAANGSVLNISSIHAHLTKRNFVVYATSKAALSGLTRSMAVDLGARVRVNAIEPAAIATDMLKAGFDGKPELYKELEKTHPAGRIGRPTEVARLAVWLASEEATFFDGACIGQDGGIRSRLHDPD